MPFMFSGVGVALPAIGRDLSMSGGSLGLFETLYLGTATVLMLPAGRIGDAGDKNTFFSLGVVLFGLTTLALAVLPSVPLLLGVRTLQGVAAALVAATNMAILTENVPRERLGRVLGLNIGAVYTGLAAGPFAAGAITTALGWRWMFTISGSVALVAAAAGLITLRRHWTWKRFDFDWLGAFTSAGGLGLLIAASATVGRWSFGWWLGAAGAALVLAFLLIEQRAASPLLSMRALREHPVLLRALTVQLLTYSGAMGTSFLLSLYLQVSRGWTARQAGWVLMISPVLMATLAPVAGRAADRLRPQLLAASGATLISMGTLTAWIAPQTASPLPLIVTALVLHGLGFATFSSPNMTVIMSQAPRSRMSMASALAALMRSLGMVTALMLVTAFMTVHLGAQGIGAPHALTGVVATVHGALGVIGVLSLWALATAWRDGLPRAARVEG